MRAIHRIVLSLIVVSLGAPVAQAASSNATNRMRRSDIIDATALQKMPSAFRVGVIGGPGFLLTEKNFENENPNSTGVIGTVFAAYGQRTFSYEIGATFLNMPFAIGIPSPAGKHRALISMQYIGVPLTVKYNYIERPLASFFVKLGVMPVMAVGSTPASVVLADGLPHDIEIPKNDVVAIAGIGGTSELGESTAFVLDISGFYGATAASGSLHFQGIVGSIGLSFEL